MNRVDTKFVLRAGQLNQLLKEAEPFYKCLNSEGRKLSAYQTLYYDTDDLTFYNQHHNGKLNRYKVRHRTYANSGETYLEVKFKSNKGRSIKKRISERTPPGIFTDEAKAFLSTFPDFDPAQLKPIVWVNYSRITLVNKQNSEKITIDLNISFRKQDQSIALNDLVIAEVKQDKKNPSPFFNILRKHRIREDTISKYCLAVALMYPEAKKNNFKEKILYLKHILTHDTFAGIYRSAG